MMKGWWSEGNFRSKHTPSEWRTSKLRKRIQIMVILMSSVLERKYASHFPNKWIPIMHQLITYGSFLNWGEIMSSNLYIQLNKVQKEHQFYMDSYILDVMCASREYPFSVGTGIQTFRPSIFIARCSRRVNIRRIMIGFVIAYLYQFIKYFS
jgi:hypothetical protein